MFYCTLPNHFFCIFSITRIFHFKFCCVCQTKSDTAVHQPDVGVSMSAHHLLSPKKAVALQSRGRCSPLSVFSPHAPRLRRCGYGRLIVTACTCPCAVALLKLDWLKIDLLCFRKGSRRGVCASRRRVRACAFLWVSLFCLHSLDDCRSVSGSGKVEQVLLLS